MNSSKVNNGWTLNPSKSFPGKFYYFNVQNGESVWTTDPEKTISKDSFNIHKLSDRSHVPQEPCTPPPDFPSTSSTVPHLTNQSTFIRPPEIQRVINNTLNKYPRPTFGKAAFSNYTSDVELYVPNIIWAPVPLPTVPSMCKLDSRRYLNMSTQTDLIDKIRVDTSSTSLSDRFTVYKSSFNRQVQKKYKTSTPVKFKYDESTSQSFCNTFQGTNKSSIPNTSLQSSFKGVRTKSEADNDTDLFGSKKLYGLNFNELIPVHRSYEDFKTKTVLKEPFERCHTVTDDTLEDFESNSIGSIDSNDLQRREPNQIDEEIEETVKFDDVTKEKDVFKLGDNDLRLLLIAKRRKSVDLGDMQGYANKTNKTYKEEEAKQGKIQKRVSFNLQLKDSESGDENKEVQVQTNEDPVELLDLPKDLWYVMVDPETLVDEYQLIEEYVLSDMSCRLLLPRCLRAAIEAMGMGDCRGRRRVIVARQSARRLAQPHAYIVTMPEVDISGNTSEISDVLKYCLKINNLGYLVVFLTNSAKLLTDAKSLKITCLNTKEIKLNLTKPPEITFDLKKVQISVTNDGCAENLKTNALPSSEFNPYVLSNREQNPEIVSGKNLIKNSSNNINDKIKKVDAITSPVGSDKLIDITKTNLNKNNVINTYEEEATDIGKDIKSSFLNELASKEILNKVELTLGSKANNEKEKHSFVFKKPHTFDMKKVMIEKEYGSKKFDVKSDFMEETIRIRLDEWLCSLSQIVEDALTQVLMRHTRFSDNTIRPWVLYDVVDHVKKLYDSHTEVRSMADMFTTMLLEQCSQIGYLKSTMPSTVFMDLFECAYLLIQALKQIQPTYYELSDAEKQLNNLLSEIENPTNIILPIAPPVTTPDIVIESIKQNFIRHPSDIIDYVKKHFENWKNYEPLQHEENISKQQNENNICGDYKIVRTCGRNLNLLNIDGKSLTVTNATETVQKDNTSNTKEDNVTSTNNLLEDLNLSNSETWVDEATNNDNILTSEETTNAINIVSESTKQEINLNQSMATPLENENFNYEHIAKTPQIQESETKLKEPEIIDLDVLDYSELKNSDSIKSKTPSPITKNDSDMSMTDAVSFVYEIRNTKSTNKTNYFNENKNYDSTNRSYLQENNNITRESNVRVTNDVSIDSLDIMYVKDESVDDSGIENDSVHAHSLVRVFLIELSQSFKTIHMFINKCVKDFRADRVREEQKLRMHAKANYLFITVADIIAELKKIIHRESNDATAVQAMLLRAGLQATEDKRITRYKQVVTKCLEQAITLENALKLILSMTGDDCDASISTCTLDTNLGYFNIFG